MKKGAKPPEERRKELIDVAARLFAEKGYESVAVRDILAEVNGAPGMFYYYFKSKGKIAILWIFLWGIAPIVSRLINGDWSVPFMLFMLIAELILIFLAIRKDWYLFSKKAVLIGFICVVIVMAAMCFNKVMHFNDYQRLRLENWMARYNIGNYVSDDNGMNYINTRLKEVFANSNLIGRSDEAVQIMTELPGYRDDLIVGSIAAYCGMLAVVGIIICLLVLSMYVFRISLKQKNNLGYIIGCACGITIAFQCVSNLMIVFGLLPMTGSFLPMISHGTSRNIVNYMLFGLILSIYRYKDIRKEDMMKSVLAKGKGRNLKDLYSAHRPTIIPARNCAYTKD